MPFWPDNDGVALNPRYPRTLGICDYCGRTWHLDELRYQMEWGGPNIINLHYRVCPRCYDKPQEQLRSIVLPPDPIPSLDPRVEFYDIDSGLQGFVQNTLDPTNSNITYAQLLQASQAWGLPQPALTNRSGTLTTAFATQQIMAANPARKYLLIYNPAQYEFGVSQTTPINFASPAAGTTLCGTGTALLQNANALTPQTVWQGAVYAMSTYANMPFLAAEG